jgi:chromosome segregation ATPase
MTDEELCKALRSALWGQGHHINIKAADRIELLATTNEQLVAINEALTAKVKLMDDLDVINGEKIEALTEQLKTVLDREAATTARYDAKTDELEAKLATCEKYRDAYAECDSIGTQAVRDLEAKLAECEARLGKAVEALRGLMQHMPDYADTVWQDACETLAEIENSEAVTLGEKT